MNLEFFSKPFVYKLICESVKESIQNNENNPKLAIENQSRLEDNYAMMVPSIKSFISQSRNAVLYNASLVENLMIGDENIDLYIGNFAFMLFLRDAVSNLQFCLSGKKEFDRHIKQLIELISYFEEARNKNIGDFEEQQFKIT